MEHVKSFDRFADFVHHASVAPAPYPEDRASRRIGARHHGVLEMGTSSFEEAQQLAKAGWPEGLAQIKTLADLLVTQLFDQVQRKTLTASVAGGAVNIGRFLVGRPDCFSVWTPDVVATGRGPIVRVVYNTGASAATSADRMFRRGSAAVALIDLLERSGRRVEVTLASRVTSKRGNGFVTVRSTLKRADEPVNLSNLAFALCNASTHRRLMWAVRETFPAAVVNQFRFRDSRGSYGSPVDMPEDQQGDLYFAKGNAEQWASTAAAEAWVRQQLHRLAGP
jgi:hypothetical protein